MASIFTTALPAPPKAPAHNAAKPVANDSAKSPGDASPFAVILASANPPKPAAPQTSASHDDNGKPGNNDVPANSGGDAAKTQATPAAATQTQAANDSDDSDAEDASDAKAQLEAAAETQTADAGAPTEKPAAKPARPASDTDEAQALLQPQTAQPDPNMIAVPAVQMATAQATPPAANDDDAEGSAAAITPAKSSPRPAQTPQASDKSPDPAGAQNPAAAAQDAIAGNSSSSNSNSKDNAQTGDGNGKTDKAQALDAKVGADKTAPQTTPQPQASATPPAPAAAALSAANMPVQASSTDHGAALSVQVAPHTAGPDLNSLAVDIATRSQSGARQFNIRLDPPELGRVEVRLSIDATGKAEAHLTADRPETLSLLQKDSSTLTQALRNSGLDVSQGGLNFSLRGQSGQAGNGQDGQGRASRSNLAASRVLDAAQNASSINFTGGTGRLDIHV